MKKQKQNKNREQWNSFEKVRMEDANQSRMYGIHTADAS